MLQGKGFWIWKVFDCEGGDFDKIIEVCKQAHLKHLIIKIADGPVNYNTSVDLPLFFEKLDVAGIEAWGWQYVYGTNPESEARKAIERLALTKAKGFVVNAEAEYKRTDGGVRAYRYINMIRNAHPELQIALSTYRYPTYHPEFPWKDFLLMSDIMMPQVYWMGAHNAGAQLRRSIGELQLLFGRIGKMMPIIPTGAAFDEHGWTPTVAEITEFLTTAKSMNVFTVNFWEWAEARKYNPELFQPVQDFVWDVEDTQVPDYTLEDRVANLEKRVTRLENSGTYNSLIR